MPDDTINRWCARRRAPVEIEITQIPDLKPGEITLLDMHSLLNVLNVLESEIALMGLQLADREDLLKESMSVCSRAKSSLTDEKLALDFAARPREMEAAILSEIASASASYPGRRNEAEVAESIANVQNVFQILEVRVQEVLARAQQPDRWICVPIPVLRADFVSLFAAMERNSRGRYRIVYNLALQKPTDYYIDFVIEGVDGDVVSLPLVFKDVMRDLIANARKYTMPGGIINVGLHASATDLSFVVRDTGCGIPPDEVESVVQFGRRGSNVSKRRTMGGGFGLTKAFLVTKRFGGRFWINSELGIGTRVSIRLPRPGSAQIPSAVR